MPEYKEHYVAFLDILGFKELLSSASCDEIHSIFDVLHEKSHGTYNLNDVEIKAFEHIHHMILSDSVIVYIESDVEDAFASLILICKKLQFALANREKPILLRGGIAVGGLFYENDIIFGEGLTKAYLLENNLAKYPRIVFTGDTLSIGFKNTKYMLARMEGSVTPYNQDDDALYYINYLQPSGLILNEIVQYFDRLKEKCRYQLNQGIESGLREKYLWLYRKIDNEIKTIINVESFYLRREKEDEEKREEDYKKRFSSVYLNSDELEVETEESEK